MQNFVAFSEYMNFMNSLKFPKVAQLSNVAGKPSLGRRCKKLGWKNCWRHIWTAPCFFFYCLPCSLSGSFCLGSLLKSWAVKVKSRKSWLVKSYSAFLEAKSIFKIHTFALSQMCPTKLFCSYETRTHQRYVPSYYLELYSIYDLL